MRASQGSGRDASAGLAAAGAAVLVAEGLQERLLVETFAAAEHVEVVPTCRDVRLLHGRLAGARAVPWTRLALELGYYDHAHFIRDFRLVVGLSPAEYASEAQSAARTPSTPLLAPAMQGAAGVAKQATSLHKAASGETSG